MTQTLQDLIVSNKDIFQNPDTLSEIFYNYDYFSLEGRIEIVNTLKYILKNNGISREQSNLIIIETMKSIATRYKSEYNTTLIKKSGTSNFGDYECEFSVLYRKSEEYPVANIDEAVYITFFDVLISSIGSVLSNGWIWNLSGLAGKVVLTTRNRKCLIYSEGLDRLNIKYYEADRLFRNLWVKNGVLDHPILPALVEYSTETGKPISEMWYRNGKLHRDDDEPAHVEYFRSTGHVWHKFWYKDGKEHRDNGEPAVLSYTDTIDNSWLSLAVWYVNGEHYRKNGPTIEVYNNKGGRIDEKDIEYL